jgi:hypothetical protein
MTDEAESTKTHETAFFPWLQATTDFWSNMSQTTMSTDSEALKDSQAFIQNRFARQWQTQVNFVKTMAQAMNNPESASSSANSISALPDIMMKMAKSAWDVGFQFQNHFLEKAGKIGKRTEAYNFENLDQEVFQALTDVYEKELRQYLHVPPLGLTRFYQERFNELLDKHNLFETTLAEFLSILYLPLEKSFQVLQEKLRDMAQEGILPKDTREGYGMWLKILEGHYMNLFKSKEYTDALHKTLSKMEDLIIAKNEAMRDILQLLPIPTNQDMDDLYKEFYHLKKRVKELEKQLNIKDGQNMKAAAQ